MIFGMMSGKHRSWQTILRIILAIVTFFTLVYAVAVIILMAGSAASSGLCEYISEVNRGRLECHKLAFDLPQSSFC